MAYKNILDQILDEMSFDKVAHLDDVDFFNGSTHTALVECDHENLNNDGKCLQCGHQFTPEEYNEWAGKTAGSANMSFSWNQDTGKVKEGDLPEVAEAANLQEDHTGIERPATKTPTQVVAATKIPTTGKGVVGAQENWHTRRATELTEDNDSVLDEALVDFNAAEKGATVEQKSLTDEEVKGKIDGWFKEAKTPRQIVARLQKLAEMELFNKSMASNYLKTEAGKMGYNFLEPNAYMDKSPATTTNTFETVKIKGSLAATRGSGANKIIRASEGSSKKAAADALLDVPTLHREGSTTESQVRGLPTVTDRAPAFDARMVAKMFQDGANLETIFLTGRAKVGSQAATHAVRTYIAALKRSKTAKVKLAQLDCSFLKGKLAAHNAIIGASKCASCTFRQGLACGLTGGTLISFPGMQAGVDRNHKIASTAKDGTHLVKEFDLGHEASTDSVDIEIREPERLDVDGTAGKTLDF